MALDEKNAHPEDDTMLFAFVTRFLHFLLEEGYEPPEEPDQRRERPDYAAAVRREQIHVLFLGMSLLLLFGGFLCFWFAHTILPLFLSTLLTFLGFRCFAARFQIRKKPPSS